MGVLGITPFLQKTCPEVIKQLPDRLRSLSGKKIVIDGTLITQRFHFTQSPHPYRHVLGWYRLIKELKEAGVSAICVFDGKERNFAKARETERRREVQRVTLVRGSLEGERSKRFHQLSRVLKRLRTLDAATQEHATGLLRRLGAQSDASLNATMPAWLSAQLTTPQTRGSVPVIGLEDNEADLQRGLDSLSLDPTTVRSDVTWEDEQDALLSLLEDDMQHSTPLTAATAPAVGRGADLKNAVLLPATPQSGPFDVGSSIDEKIPFLDVEDTLPSGLVDDAPGTLASLYINYRRSKSSIAALSTTTALTSSTPTQADVVMSKTQLQLTLDEGCFWHNLASSEITVAPQPTLAMLTKTSGLMLESYQRRTNTPSVKNYDECREILQAMGVPCLDSAGAFEAEALASSIVLNGLADYVASEDTDVLVYEAPLIRNLTNRQGPLTVFSSAEIRKGLQLTRSSFIDFALLLGTDFSQRIKNVGPSRAFRFIKEHGSIERIIAVETKYPPQMPIETYMGQVEVARIVFESLPAVPSRDLLEGRIADEASVTEVLQRYNLGRELMASGEWDYGAALDGNYFEDNPSATGVY